MGHSKTWSTYWEVTRTWQLSTRPGVPENIAGHPDRVGSLLGEASTIDYLDPLPHTGVRHHVLDSQAVNGARFPGRPGEAFLEPLAAGPRQRPAHVGGRLSGQVPLRDARGGIGQQPGRVTLHRLTALGPEHQRGEGFQERPQVLQWFRACLNTRRRSDLPPVFVPQAMFVFPPLRGLAGNRSMRQGG